MRSEKGLSRYREEQNLTESDLNLSGFVHLFLSPFLIITNASFL